MGPTSKGRGEEGKGSDKGMEREVRRGGGKERGRGWEGEEWQGEGDGREGEEGKKVETPPPSIPAYAPAYNPVCYHVMTVCKHIVTVVGTCQV